MLYVATNAQRTNYLHSGKFIIHLLLTKKGKNTQKDERRKKPLSGFYGHRSFFLKCYPFLLTSAMAYTKQQNKILKGK